MDEEKKYFEKGKIYVTESRLVIANTVYYLNTITSIRTTQTDNKEEKIIDRYYRKMSYRVLVLALVVSSVGGYGVTREFNGLVNEILGIIFIIGIIGFLIGFWMYLNSSTYIKIDEYHLKVVTAASEIQVYSTEDLDEINLLVDAINRAKSNLAKQKFD